MVNTKDSTKLETRTLNSNNIIFKIEKYIVTVVQALIGVLLALMVVIVFSNVVARYVFSSTLAWSEEISRFMLIWVAFLGAVIAYIKGEHLGLDVMLKILPAKSAAIVQIIANCLVLFAILILVRGGVDLTASSLNSGWTSPAAGVSYGMIYSIVPISLLLFLYFSIIKLIDSILILVSALKREA